VDDVWLGQEKKDEKLGEMLGLGERLLEVLCEWL
jgi:hypothetical protein